MITDLLSVLIPAYNPDEKVLRGILDSLTAQANGYNVEIIVVDDGSDVIPIWVMEYPNTHLFTQANQGEPSARNTLLEAAHGEWFTFIDCDDEISDDYLSVVIGNMRDGYDWVSYNWTCDGSRAKAEQNKDALMINCAVWAYSFKTGFNGDEMFNPKLLLGCDTDWLRRTLKPWQKHKHDDRVIYNYRWDGNDNSLCHKKLRGEIR